MSKEISRRGFLKLAAVFAGGMALNACGSEGQKPETFIDNKLVKLGEDVANWKTAAGTPMEQFIPGIGEITKLLRGQTDPRTYFPFLKVPISYTNNVDKASFRPNLEFNNDTSAPKIHVASPSQSFDLPVLKKDLNSALALTPADEQSTIRLPIIVKEASQVVDWPEYCRTYVNLLKTPSVSITGREATGLSETEFTIAIAAAEMDVEMAQKGTAWLLRWIDMGSFIRYGGIAFANWYKQELLAGRQPSGPSFDAGSHMAGFLQAKGLFTETSEGFVWTAGTPPAIDSPEFYSLFSELSPN